MFRYLVCAAAVLALGCTAPSDGATRGDACAAAARHVQACFPEQDIAAPATCDATQAERVLGSSCEDMRQPEGKADGWWCTPWTWWLCGSGGGTGAEVRLAGSLNGPRALAGDGTALYYVLDDPTHGRVVRYTSSSGSTNVLAELQAGPRELAVDATHVYWINQGSSELMRAPRSGGTAEVLASGGPKLIDLAVDETDVYASGDGGLWRMPKAGGTLEQLSDLGVASYKTAPSLVLDDAAVFILDSWSDAQLHRVSKADGTRSVLASNTGVSALAAHGDHVYWHGGEAGVQRVAKHGGTVESLGGASTSGSDAVVIASSWIYFTDRMGGRVLRLPLTGGEQEELAGGQDGPMGLVVDASAIYWTNEGTYSGSDYNEDGELMKLDLSE